MLTQAQLNKFGVMADFEGKKDVVMIDEIQIGEHTTWPILRIIPAADLPCTCGQCPPGPAPLDIWYRVMN